MQENTHEKGKKPGVSEAWVVKSLKRGRGKIGDKILDLVLVVMWLLLQVVVVILEEIFLL